MSEIETPAEWRECVSDVRHDLGDGENTGSKIQREFTNGGELRTEIAENCGVMPEIDPMDNPRDFFDSAKGWLVDQYNDAFGPGEVDVLYNQRLDVAQDFLTKYEDSVENGTFLTPEDMREIQTLYFEGHLTGGDDSGTMNAARNGVDAVFDKPEAFGLVNTDKGVAFEDYQKGDRGYAFTELPKSPDDMANPSEQSIAVQPNAPLGGPGG